MTGSACGADRDQARTGRGDTVDCEIVYLREHLCVAVDVARVVGTTLRLGGFGRYIVGGDRSLSVYDASGTQRLASGRVHRGRVSSTLTEAGRQALTNGVAGQIWLVAGGDPARGPLVALAL